MNRDPVLQVKADLAQLARLHGDCNTPFGMLFDLSMCQYDGPTPVALVREVVARHLGACTDTTLASLIADFDAHRL